MTCSECTRPVPAARLLVSPRTLTCSPRCSGIRDKRKRRENMRALRARRAAMEDT